MNSWKIRPALPGARIEDRRPGDREQPARDHDLLGAVQLGHLFDQVGVEDRDDVGFIELDGGPNLGGDTLDHGDRLSEVGLQSSARRPGASVPKR